MSLAFVAKHRLRAASSFPVGGFPQPMWMPAEQSCGQAGFAALATGIWHALANFCAVRCGFPQLVWKRMGIVCGVHDKCQGTSLTAITVRGRTVL